MGRRASVWGSGSAISSDPLVEYKTICCARNAIRSAHSANTRSRTTAHCWSVHRDISRPLSVPLVLLERPEPTAPSLGNFSGNVLNTVSMLGMPTTSSPSEPVIRIPHTRTLYSVSAWSPVRRWLHIGPRYTCKEHDPQHHVTIDNNVQNNLFTLGWAGFNVMLYTLHHVSKKQAKLFCYNYIKLPPTPTIFGTKMANCLKLYEVHSFFHLT